MSGMVAILFRGYNEGDENTTSKERQKKERDVYITAAPSDKGGLGTYSHSENQD